MSRILNEDVLIEIMSYLSIKDLLKLEITSKQFKYCANQVLKQQNNIRFGFDLNYHCFDSNYSTIDCDINNAIISVRNKWIQSGRDLIASKLYLKPLFDKCFGIKSLEMDDIIVNESVVQFMAQSFTQLKCLRIGFLDLIIGNNCLVYRLFAQYFGQQLIDLHLNGIYLEDIEVIKSFPKLKELSISHFDSLFIPLKRLCDNLGNNVKTLRLLFQNMTTIYDLNEFIVHKSTQNIVNLFIEEMFVIEETNNQNIVFEQICQNLIQLQTLSFKKSLFMSMNPIICLKNLQNFEFVAKYETFISFSSFGSQSLPNMCSLTLNSVDLKPLSLQNIHNLFPNLKKLFLINCRFLCECVEEIKNCLICSQNCCQSFSELKDLKVIHIISVSMHFNQRFITSLKEFSKLSDIKLMNFDLNHKFINEFIDALIDYSLEHQKRWITVRLEDYVFAFKSNEKIIPKNMKILKII
jgi:hypothetical protein